MCFWEQILIQDHNFSIALNFGGLRRGWDCPPNPPCRDATAHACIDILHNLCTYSAVMLSRHYLGALRSFEGCPHVR